MKAVIALAVALLFVGSAQAQQLRKGQSPVFYPASQLAEDCRVFLDIFPDGKPLPNDTRVRISEDQAIHIAKCSTYIRAFQDTTIEPSRSAHYTPVSADLSDMGTLAKTFLKIVADHPEQSDMAASTILLKARELIVKTEGVR